MGDKFDKDILDEENVKDEKMKEEKDKGGKDQEQIGEKVDTKGSQTKSEENDKIPKGKEEPLNTPDNGKQDLELPEAKVTTDNTTQLGKNEEQPKEISKGKDEADKTSPGGKSDKVNE